MKAEILGVKVDALIKNKISLLVATADIERAILKR